MYKSKTMWAAALVAMLGVLQMSTDALKTLLDEHTFGWVMIAVGVLMAGLRVFTSQPLNEK